MEERNYPGIYRIMHWAIAICMLLLLITIFLRMTWMNRENVADIIQQYLLETERAISRDDAVVLAKKIRKPTWDWHIYLGYTLVGLYSIRMAMPFFGKMKFSNPFKKELSAKVKFQYWTYLVFYVCVGASLVTGLIIELGPQHLKKSTEEIHALSIYYLLAFIAVHVGGVLIAEFTNRRGIVSRIVSGQRKITQPAKIESVELGL